MTTELSDEFLIPDDGDLFDGTISRKDFIEGGNGFVWNALVNRAQLKPDDYVLDMGSGNGQKSRVLTKILSSSGKYFGFDVDKKAIEWCSNRYKVFGNFNFFHSNVISDWYNADGEFKASEYKFPLEDSTIDVAFAASLFTHLQPEETQNYISEAFRVLKPGGRLFMTCFMITARNNGRHEQKVQDSEFSRVSDIHWHLDVSAPSRGVAYDEASLRGILEDAGFVNSELYFGRWSNSIDALGALQDAVLAIKPLN